MSEDIEITTDTGHETVKGPKEKMEGHRERMLRTGVAFFMGILTGILSYVVVGDPTTSSGAQLSILGWLFMLAGIVFQKHIFMALKIDYQKLGGKDWFYQAFMTFAFWFMSWTVLISLP